MDGKPNPVTSLHKIHSCRLSAKADCFEFYSSKGEAVGEVGSAIRRSSNWRY